MKRVSVDVFGYTDYRAYLSDWIRAHPNSGYGVKSKIAHVVGCKPGYLTAIFGGISDLSAEQAERLSSYLRHEDPEKEYFLTLVFQSRARTDSLRLYFAARLDRLRAARRSP